MISTSCSRLSTNWYFMTIRMMKTMSAGAAKRDRMSRTVRSTATDKGKRMMMLPCLFFKSNCLVLPLCQRFLSALVTL